MKLPNSTVVVHDNKAVLVMAADRLHKIPQHLHKNLTIDDYIKYLEDLQ